MRKIKELAPTKTQLRSIIVKQRKIITYRLLITLNSAQGSNTLSNKMKEMLQNGFDDIVEVNLFDIKTSKAMKQ